MLLALYLLMSFEFARSQISNLQKQMNDHTDSVQTATTSWRYSMLLEEKIDSEMCS